MKRVMIVGQPGAGKSTLARQLGERTGLPVVHIDTIHWLPGWVERSRDEKTRLCHEVEAREWWIFEGGHSATWENRLARAELLIWIDRSLTVRLWRVLVRTLTQLGAHVRTCQMTAPSRYTTCLVSSGSSGPRGILHRTRSST